MPSTTFHGPGTTVEPVAITASCQAAIRRTANPSGRSHFSDRMREPDLLEDAVAQLEVARRAEVARARDVDLDDLADGRGPRRHHDDAIGELHGLLDVVGDEQDRLLLGLPDPQQ